MKMLCFRYPRNTVTDILICLLCIFIIILILNNAEYNRSLYCSVSQDEIISFLEINGWIANTGQVSSSEKVIPEIFDVTYNDYALLQKKQGFDFENYKGKQITLYSYPLLNYPGYENCDNIFINILTFNGSIIGADIYCTSINGFITGAVKDGNYQT